MQIEVIRDLRERKMQIVLDEREGGYGIELLNYIFLEPHLALQLTHIVGQLRPMWLILGYLHLEDLTLILNTM